MLGLLQFFFKVRKKISKLGLLQKLFKVWKIQKKFFSNLGLLQNFLLKLGKKNFQSYGYYKNISKLGKFRKKIFFKDRVIHNKTFKKFCKKKIPRKNRFSTFGLKFPP